MHQPGFLWAEHFRVLIPFIAINKTYFITRTRACQAPDSDGNVPLLLAAGRIGEVLRQSARGHQILCITHTAQIAALADCHLLIQKNVTNDRTYTEIHPLDTEGRVEALARLISGDHVTELSRANAREMLGTGRQ